METVTVTLSTTMINQLKDVSQKVGVRTDELIKIAIEEKLNQLEGNSSFDKLSQYVLNKNKELYQRLA
ncbi:MAG: putative DNA-binding protein [bacterium]|jgi:predicted DNA-binding protein